MAGTPEPYAVVSCHVERILDDRLWKSYRSLIDDRPGGFAIASLVRPPDEGSGEDSAVWLERVRRLRGPLGHHTHWTAPDHARPLDGVETGERVVGEAAWLREQGLTPTCFCGGGWYWDASVAAACAALGYVDCTPRARRPPRLAEGEAWAELGSPAVVATEAGSLLAIPTTHSLGELARATFRPRGFADVVVHGYFHDTDILDSRRRRALVAALTVLGRRRRPIGLDDLAAALRGEVETVSWNHVARGRPVDHPE